MATQTMRAMGPTVDTRMARKPLPAPPSPTLTNPDMVLPDEPRRFGAFGSPPRYARREQPPSPSYLRDPSSDLNRLRGGGSSGGSMVTPKKEKLGLMSRKMMLLRSRTASNGVQVVAAEQMNDEFENFDSAYGSSPTLKNEDNFASYVSSPTLMDIGNLAPPQQEQRRVSTGGSSLSSDDLSSLPQFLAKYQSQGSTITDDEDDEGTTPTSPRYEESVDGRLVALQKQQEEDEHTSALLSQRAEQILANAKKRLNLMEGNLRGARDLVQPLTSANLKRATSVGSSYIAPTTRTYGGRNRPMYDPYNYESPSNRRLQPQASAPNLDQDFHQGHWRGFSETSLPDRPATALDTTASPIIANGRIPTKAADPAWANALKGSRSYDSLGILRHMNQRDQAYVRASPDPNLEPLTEDDGQYHAVSTPFNQSGDQHEGLGIRPESRSDDLREQMSSLKGRISSLRERAREDSLRRASMQNLREPSPLNNATANAPEFFYQSSPTYGRPPLDTNAGVGWTSQKDSPVVPPPPQFTGSRNAFAEEEQRTMQQEQQRSKSAQETRGRSQKSGQKARRPSKEQPTGAPTGSHKRTPSGTAIVQSSKQQYSHHQQQSSIDSTEGFVDARATNGPRHQRQVSDGSKSETGETVYEDAESEQQAPVVAHEDREDAFDYKEFFLHSAMQVYGSRRPSVASEASTTSTATARGPTIAGAQEQSFLNDDDDEDELNGYAPEYLPAAPETPERLREIERNLHKRTFSDESVSTMATFATATEGRDSPDAEPQTLNPVNWPMTAPSSNSRPTTAIPTKQPSAMARSDSSSERADSGVGGMPARSYSSQSAKRPTLRSVVSPKSAFSASPTAPPIASPPMSPHAMVDPATLAVNALLSSNGRQLGLKDKVLLFGLVESLTKVCRRLQEGDEGDYEGRVLRRRLDGARRELEGLDEIRPSSS